MTSDVEDGELLSSDDENIVESERSDFRTLKEELNDNNKSDRNYQLYENQAPSNHDRNSNTQKIKTNSIDIDNKEIMNKKIKYCNGINNIPESKESNPYKRRLNTNYFNSINGNEVSSKRQRITDENNYPVKNELIEGIMNHDDSLENYKKSRLCKYYSANECKNGANCAYMHEQFPCKFFHDLNATCYSGNNCRYSHAPLTDETKVILESFLNDNKSIKCEETTSVNKTSERPRCLLPTPPESQSQTQLINQPIQSDCNLAENPILPKMPHKSRFSDRQVVRPAPYAPIPTAVSTYKPINFPPPKPVPMVNSIGQPLQRFQPDITQPPPIVLPNDSVIKSEPTAVRLPGQPIPSQAAIKSFKKPPVKSISKNVQIQEAIKKLADKISIKSTQPVVVSKPNELVSNNTNSSSFFPPVSNCFYNETGSNEWQPLERKYISITAKDLEEAPSPKRYTFEKNEPEYTSEGDWATPYSLDLPINKCYAEMFISVDNLHVNPLCDPRFTYNEVLDRLDNSFDNDLYYGFLKIKKTNESIKSN